MYKPISAIIPAFNEAQRIGQIIAILQKVKAVKEIIVIDDGSSDETALVVSRIKGVKLIKLSANQGKTKAVMAGVKQAKFEHLLLMDADLEGLQASHLERLIKVWNMGYRMVILNYSNQEWVLRNLVKGFPALSGVRCLEKADFFKIKFYDSDRFELETRINRYFLDQKLAVGWIEGQGVRTPHKLSKYGPIHGNLLELQASKEIALANGRMGGWGLYRQWRQIAECKIDDNKLIKS